MSRLEPAAPFTSTQTRLWLASMEHLARMVDSETIDGPRYELYSYETEHEYLKKDASYLCDIGNVEEARALLEASPQLKSHVAIVMRNARDYREQEVFIYGPTLSQA